MNLVTTFAIHCLVIIQIKIAYSNLRWLVLKCTKHILNNLWSLVRLEFWLLALPGKCTMSQAMVFLVGKPLIGYFVEREYHDYTDYITIIELYPAI